MFCEDVLRGFHNYIVCLSHTNIQQIDSPFKYFSKVLIVKEKHYVHATQKF